MVIHTINYISIDDRLIYERETGVESAVRITVYLTRGQIIEPNQTIQEEFKEDLVQFEDEDYLMLEFEFLRVGFSFADLTEDQICKLNNAIFTDKTPEANRVFTDARQVRRLVVENADQIRSLSELLSRRKQARHVTIATAERRRSCARGCDSLFRFEIYATW